MKKLFTLLAVMIVALSSLLPVYAADGKVIYEENAKQFIFEPGSSYSPTDLFSSFKDVMPGDTVTQRITVKNSADNGVNVRIYLRSLGADAGSADFLSKLGLKVSKSGENAYMFDAAASESAALTDWVCLGTLYSGGEVELDVTLTVPIELSNEYQNKIGYLDWGFKVEEIPVSEGEPQIPTEPTKGIDPQIILWILLAFSSLATFVTVLLKLRKTK